MKDERFFDIVLLTSDLRIEMQEAKTPILKWLFENFSIPEVWDYVEIPTLKLVKVAPFLDGKLSKNILFLPFTFKELLFKNQLQYYTIPERCLSKKNKRLMDVLVSLRAFFKEK